MLAVTETAAQAVTALVSQPGLPDEAGLRIAAATQSQNGGAPSPELELTVVPAPEPEDRAIEEPPIYIEPGTAEYLADMVLDAEVDEGQVRFSLHEQQESSDQ
jgi:iron-sulfur cluster assembly protein